MTMTEKKFRLTDMELDEVSLVISGDDPSARVLLAKVDPDFGDNKTHGGTTLTINKADLSDEVRVYIDELEGSLSDALDLITDDLSKDDDDEFFSEDDDTEISDEIENESEEDLMEKTDPIIKARIEKLEADLAFAHETAENERAIRIRKEASDTAKQFGAIGKSEEITNLLLDLDDEQREQVEGLLKTASKQIEEGALYAEFGKDSVSLGVSATVEGRAAELRKENSSLTAEQAIAKAMDEDPEAYEAYLKGDR